MWTEVVIFLGWVTHAKVIAKEELGHVLAPKHCWKSWGHVHKGPESIYFRAGTCSFMLYHPRKIQHGFQKAQPNTCSKSHRSSNDKKRSTACTHKKCKKLNTETWKDKDRYFVLLLFQTSLVGMSCLREENHLSSYFFVHKMGIILTSPKYCENKYIEDCMDCIVQCI